MAGEVSSYELVLAHGRHFGPRRLVLNFRSSFADLAVAIRTESEPFVDLHQLTLVL